MDRRNFLKRLGLGGLAVVLGRVLPEPKAIVPEVKPVVKAIDWGQVRTVSISVDEVEMWHEPTSGSACVGSFYASGSSVPVWKHVPLHNKRS